MQQLARALELGGAHFVVMAVQRGDRRHHRAAFEPAQEALGLRRDHLLGLRHRLAADLQVVLDDVRQVVDAVEEHVVELARFGLDVARHREIDDEHRRVAARLDHPLEQPLADDRQRARGAGDDDVELVQPVGQLVQRDRVGAEALGELLAALERAVGDGDRLRASSPRSAWR